MKPEAVFFDLDGTLADTAADLGAALNHVVIEEGLAPLPLTTLRPAVSQGVRGLLRVGMQMQPDHPRYNELQDRVLDFYINNICVHTRLFDGMHLLLEKLEAEGIPWGVITNKRARFTLPLMKALCLDQRAACMVSGDTTPKPKPAPEPMLHACAMAKVNPAHCWYIGDDLRDIQAGHAVGMKTIAAAYGYLGDGPHVAEWQAEAIVSHPNELLHILLAS